MTRFRGLLTPDPALNPGEEQRRASAGLADAISGSHLRWWKGEREQGECLLLIIAPYSQYDLTLLDLLDEYLGDGRPRMPVYIANVLDFASVEDLRAAFPWVGDTAQTPIVAQHGPGSPEAACGKKGRDLVARALSLSADELSRRVLAESRGYAHPGV
jgi:hypothetical protein